MLLSSLWGLSRIILWSPLIIWIWGFTEPSSKVGNAISASTFIKAKFVSSYSYRFRYLHMFSCFFLPCIAVEGKNPHLFYKHMRRIRNELLQCRGSKAYILLIGLYRSLPSLVGWRFGSWHCLLLFFAHKSVKTIKWNKPFYKKKWGIPW